MADDDWWSGVSQRSDDVRVDGAPEAPAAHRRDPLTDPLPDPLTDPLPADDRDVTLPVAPTVEPRSHAPAVDDLFAAPTKDLPPTPAADDLFAPAATVDLPPTPAADDLFATPAAASAPPPPPAPVAPTVPAADVVLDDEGEVPFWLLPPPPRPGVRPAARSAAPSVAQAAPQAVPDAPAVGGVADLFGPRTGAPAPPRAGRAPAPVRMPAARAGGAVDLVRQRAADVSGSASAFLERAGRSAAPALARARAQAAGLPRGPLVAGAAAAVALLTVVVLVLLLTGGGEDGGGTTATKPSSGPTATATPVDPGTVEASASSVQDPDGGTTYEVANTLDGKLTTAWNSNGGANAVPVGITLRYTFADPVDLRSVSIANGYQKVIKSGGKNRDLYASNARVKQVKVVTDAGEWTWTLKDAKAPQALRKSFGTTKTVTLEIVSVYKGTKYPDIGVSEVAFTGVAAG